MEKISVIIPVFNGAKYIAEAINSVIHQTLQPFEIIVIDDGSTDETAEVVKKNFPQVHYYYKKNGGLSSSLNAGVEKVEGDFIAFLDADDYWVLNKLEKQIQVIINDNDVEIVFGHHKRFYDKPHDLKSREENTDEQRILPGYFKATMLIKKRSFYKVGMFDETIHMGDFLDWYRRACDLELKMHMLPEVVFYRRIHTENSSLKNKAHISDYVRIVKSSMDRRRNKI